MPLLGYQGAGWSPVVKALVAALLLSLVVNFWPRYPQLPRIIAYQGIKKAMKLKLTYWPGNWQKEEDRQLVIYYREEDAAVVPLVLAVSQEALAKVNQALGYAPSGKIPVMVYSDRAALNQSLGWDADVSAMGVYWAGVIKILSPYAWASSEEKILEEEFRTAGPVTHEYVHLVVDELTRGNYTRWLTEALAQYWEREITGFQFDHPEGHLKQKLYSLEEMDRHFDDLPNQALAYSQSLALADFLYEQYGQQQVQQLLAALGKGMAMSQALQQSIGLDQAGFEQEFRQWLASHLRQQVS